MKEEVIKELIKGVCIAIDLLGIDVVKAFPNLCKELERLERKEK